VTTVQGPMDQGKRSRTSTLPAGRTRGRDHQDTDSVFLARTMAVILENLDNSGFNTAGLSEQLGYSRMHVNRRLRSITGWSTGALIRYVRLRRAWELVNGTRDPVGSIAQNVGFLSVSHFSQIFKAAWGLSPLELRRSRVPGLS
jgi:transcriptional regulator GlxA family with amidase domain